MGLSALVYAWCFEPHGVLTVYCQCCLFVVIVVDGGPIEQIRLELYLNETLQEVTRKRI